MELITTKANWEFDVDVDMDALFAPMTMEKLIQLLNDREDERLKKVAEEMEKKRRENSNKGQNQGSFGGFGGMGGMGGLGGSGSTSGSGGLRTGF